LRFRFWGLGFRVWGLGLADNGIVDLVSRV
jgi:hypothetical protein